MTTSREPIPFHRPSLGAAERDAMLEVLDSGWLTTGTRTAAFEEAFAGFVAIRHAVALNSATAALHLGFEALGVTTGDEVIVPTYTFAASAETVLHLGARPILVDVDPVTTNVRPSDVEGAIGERTRAIEVVHVGGLPADLAGLLDVAGDTPIVEDAAHAFPSPMTALGGRMAGTLGRVGAYSFYATKTITTGEGGMLVTDDDAIAARVRTMRLHGIGRDAWKRYAAGGSWFYEIEAAGFKANPTDISSALGLAQLVRASALRTERERIAGRYRALLADAEEAGRLILPPEGSGDEHAWHLFVVRLGPEAGTASGRTIDEVLPGVASLPTELRPLASLRARVITAMAQAGIGTSVHFIPLHLHPLYRSMGYQPGQFPNAESAYAGAISLPIWPGMTDAQVDRVATTTDAATSAA